MSDEELPATSARLSLHADGGIEMDIPQGEDDDELPPHVLFIAALGVLIKRDGSFMSDIINLAFPTKH